jgi:acetyl-CoA acetyltransferase
VTATLRDRAAIVGIGATEFSKNSGRTELQLAAECTKAALDDAGLSPTDVDGMVTFSMDSSDEIEVARTVGIRDLRLLSRIPHGGGAACGIVHQAAMAVATGTADVVVCYRALNGRSGLRFGGDWASQGPVTADLIHWSWYLPYGLMTPASWVAMVTQRYMHEFGATSEDLGRVSVATRTYAATNPAAYFYGKPITLEDHQSSRPIVDPLRLLDCCQESDGGAAVVVTSVERARDLRQTPAVIRAASQGAGYDQEVMTSFYRDDLTDVSEIRITADQLWETSGIGPEDIQAAVIYDAFTAIVLFQLEAFGFCKRGEAAAFVADGSLEIDGRLPVNTHGGQLGEAYIHGVNGVSEGVRQIRGTSPNPVEGVEHVLVTSGVGVPSSGLVLGRA